MSAECGVRAWRRATIAECGVRSVSLALVLALCLVAGCTVRPKVVANSRASFDGNQANSGLIGYDQAGNGIFTPHAIDRYNALMATYGGRFAPPVAPGAGVVPTATNTFLLDRQHRFYFETANRWRKAEGNH